MPLILTQTDTASDCGPLQGCSGVAAAGVAELDKLATEGGTAGVTEVTVTIGGQATQRAAYFQSGNNEPGTTSWDAGNYVVRINVTTAQMSITWEDCYVCRFDNACGSLATVGSLTGQGISCGTTGVKSMTISGAAQTAGATDEIFIVLVFASSAMNSKSIGITPNQDIDTPIVVGVTEEGSANLEGAGSISAKANAILAAIASLQGAGSLSAEGLRLLLAAASPTGDGTVVADGIRQLLAEAAFSGNGSLSADALRLLLGEAAPVGDGSLTAEGLRLLLAELAASGDGALAAEAMRLLSAGANPVGDASIEAVGTVIESGAPAARAYIPTIRRRKR